MNHLMFLQSEKDENGEEEADQRPRTCHFRNVLSYPEALVSSRRVIMAAKAAPIGVPRNITTLVASIVYESATPDSGWLRIRLASAA